MFPELIYLFIEKKTKNNLHSRMCQAVIDFQSVLANCNKLRAPLPNLSHFMVLIINIGLLFSIQELPS